jgi:hypothetical protein
MPRRKEPIEYADVPVKDCWHPFGLQGLNPQKFAFVISMILDGKYDLLDLRKNEAAKTS